jgi:hypothetical protein
VPSRFVAAYPSSDTSEFSATRRLGG